MNRLVPQAIQSFLKNKRFNSSSGSQLRDFVHIDDVIKAIINSIFLKSNQTQIINIGSGKPITVKNMVLNILKIVKTGKTNFGKIKMRKDEHPEIYPNVSKAKKIIKWSAKIPLMKGLRQTVKSYDE